MATVQEIKATSRARTGKGAARAVRREGRVPGVIYGNHEAPLAITVDSEELQQRIAAGRFLTTLYDVDVDGAKQRVIPRDFQLDPVKDAPIHVDFLRLGAGAEIRVRIPIHVVNTDRSPGIKRGGTVNVVTHSLEVICPAEEIPQTIDVDVAGLEIGHSKHLDDIALPANVRPIVRGDATLVTIVPPSGYAEEIKAAAEAAAAAAAAAAVAAPGAPAEGAPAAPGAAPAAGAEKPEKK